MIDLKKLKKEQIELSKKIILKDGFKKINLIAGVDQAYLDEKVISCIAVFSYPKLELREKKFAMLKVNFPYISGFLAYREMPVIIEAFHQLENKPDLVLVDANGILHPRRCGMASHLGLVLNLPTIGISKRLSLGEVKNGRVFSGKDLVGFEVKTREKAKPLYISPGHLVSFGSCLKIIKETIKYPHKLPEPLHAAHRLVNCQREYLIRKNKEKMGTIEDAESKKIENKKEENQNNQNNFESNIK